MIDEISVEDLALIEAARFEPSVALTAITGETGTGKTVLLEACRLLMGERSDRTMVREGRPSSRVEGRFFIPRTGNVEAVDNDSNHAEDFIDGAEEEVVVSRICGADGRSRVKVNGRMTSVAELSALVSPMIDLCSQHEQQLLLKASEQRAMLDAWIGEDCRIATSRYEKAYSAYMQARSTLEQLRGNDTARKREIEDARFTVEQIGALNPREGEYEELVAHLQREENAEALAMATGGASQALSGDGAAIDSLGAAIEALETGGKYDSALFDMAAALKDALYLLEDASRDISRYADGLEVDEDALESMRNRVADYQGLARRYGGIDQMLHELAQARDRLSQAEDVDFAISKAERELEAADAQLISAADALSDIRQRGATRFGEAVSGVLKGLAMGSSSIVCKVGRLPRDEWNRFGADTVELLFKPSSSLQPRSLSRIASGGELSRVMLAIHACMGETSRAQTLIFDEIDAGVGGEVAKSLSSLLVDLSKTHQVIVVTHLPQIASRADRQFVVTKEEEAGVANSSIREVCGQERIGEIARMLSGSVTEKSRALALELFGDSLPI